MSFMKLPAVLLTSGFCLLVLGCEQSQPVAKKGGKIAAIPVKAVAVTKTDVPQTTLQPASIHAFFRSELRAKVSGYVKTVDADIGDVVKAGDTLATIDVPEMTKQREVILAKIRRYEADEQRAAANVQLAKAGVKASDAMVGQAVSQMGSVEASLAAAEAGFQRTQDLVRRGSLQNRKLDEVRKMRDSESARREATTSSIESAQAEVSVALAQQQSAEANLLAAKAETDIARRQLDELDVLMQYATIKAPLDGVVTYRTIELGDLVSEENSTRTDPLFVVSQVDTVRVRIPVPESVAPMINNGDEISLTFPSFANESPIRCNVTRRSGSLDPGTRTMMVEAELDNADGKLLPGMFGQARINLATKIAASMLPSQAIRFDEGGKAYVYALSDDDTVTVTAITTGMDDGNAIEVLSGIESGQRVIDSHLKRFTDGQKVAVMETNK